MRARRLGRAQRDPTQPAFEMLGLATARPNLPSANVGSPSRSRTGLDGVKVRRLAARPRGIHAARRPPAFAEATAGSLRGLRLARQPKRLRREGWPRQRESNPRCPGLKVPYPYRQAMAGKLERAASIDLASPVWKTGAHPSIPDPHGGEL